MVDELSKIDKPLFQTTIVKKVRETSRRPEDGRTARDTYSESDEIVLSSEAERLQREKSKRGKKLHKEKEQDQENVESKTDNDEAGEAGIKIKHVNIVV